MSGLERLATLGPGQLAGNCTAQCCGSFGESGVRYVQSTQISAFLGAGDWASLAPRLLLPLGMKGLYVPLLRGIADVASQTGHGQMTPLIPGINTRQELEAFRSAAAALGLTQIGAVLQSPAGLAEGASIV